MEYGELVLHLDKLLRERGISKNRICKDLDIPRSKLNRYCRNEFQRVDALLICKLCCYLDVEVGQLLQHIPSEIRETSKD